MSKIMKIIRKKVNLVVLLLIAVTLLGGCVPTWYTKSQEKDLVQDCLPAINEFLTEHCGEYELGEFNLKGGYIDPINTMLGKYGSNVVIGSYTSAGNTWRLVYDRETGKFYTDELLEKLREHEEARILEYLKEEIPEEDLKDFNLAALSTYYLVQSHDIRTQGSTTSDTYVYIYDMLPAEITEEDLPEFAARGFDGGCIGRIVCHYNSDRANALTKEDFKQFFTDNPAYRVEQYFFLYNDNPSAKEEITAGNKTDAENVPESEEETLFCPKPVGKEADCSIEYEKNVIFARRPYFTESDGIVTMQFNAIDWYCVRVIHREDAKKYFPDEKMLTQSSNLKVFRSYENQKFEYSCVFVPYDGSDFAFLFETDISPEAMSFGFGFRDCIHYYSGGEEVFPDRELDRSVFEIT